MYLASACCKIGLHNYEFSFSEAAEAEYRHQETSPDEQLRRVLSPVRRRARGLLGRAGQADRLAAPATQVLDDSNPPFARWFVGGTTNLCHNAVDRHLADRGDQPALIFVSTETGVEQSYSFAELHAEVQRTAASLMALGVGKGDRVLIYMPMIPEAAFAMLACARIGAIHCVVFGGFASGSLATRIEDAEPKVIVSADAGARGGKVLAYKPLLDEAIRLSSHKPAAVLLSDRGLAAMELVAGRDHLASELRQKHLDAKVPCTWLASTDISYTIYTSGTTGKPKGVQRDVGGYAVALAASMKHIFDGRPGETYFSTSDIGWVVGHSYIVYGPLIAGMATIMYEGLPTQGIDRQPDGGIWWRLVEKYKVTVMFSAPTAVRVLKKQDPALLKKYDLSSLRALFLAGEPLDEPTARWISDGLGVPVIDNYWQTESGWPMITIANGVEPKASKFGSPGVPMYGYRIRILHESTGEELTGANEKGVVVVEGRRRRVSCRPCGRTMRGSSTPTGRPCLARWSIPPSTGASGTRTATSTSSGAPTTSSTWRATGSARVRSRKASPAMPTSPKWRWLAWPMRSRARSPWPSW